MSKSPDKGVGRTRSASRGTPGAHARRPSPSTTRQHDVPNWLGHVPSQSRNALVRAAFLGRVSTDDLQDPTLSIPRQVNSVRSALPADMNIVAYFYDVESGRTGLDLRGKGQAYKQFEISTPREGGVDDLLREAYQPNRRFDVVVCESIDRIARITYFGTKIEHELAQAGVVLLAADETLDVTRQRATDVLTRRVKQGISEWYVLDMLEKAWGGFEEHTAQGWNVGKPPYGYAAEKVPHPVPARRAEGKHKTRLVIDPSPAATVRRIYALRIEQGMGYEAIARMLNEDLTLNPPPIPPDPARALGRWSASSVREVLKNPKYTGHMTWNRRASKRGGHLNPISEWVVSSEITHPPIISTDQFAAASDMVQQQRSRYAERRTGASDATPPRPQHTYALRSYVWCQECDRRMYGALVRRTIYYVCYPRDRPVPPEHPTTLRLPEATLMIALEQFINTRLLGENRLSLLQHGLDVNRKRALADHNAQVETLNRAIKAITKRQANLLNQSETNDRQSPGVDPFTLGLRTRYNALETERQDHEARLQQLTGRPPEPDLTDTAALLATLPQLTLNIREMPPHILQEVVEAFRIKIAYNYRTASALFTAEIAADSPQGLSAAMAGQALRVSHVPPAGLEPALQRF
jgi:site-specific DNA recombinase